MFMFWDLRIVRGKGAQRSSNPLNPQLGYELEGDKLNAVFDRFKVVAEKKKGGLEDEVRDGTEELGE